MFKYLTRNLKLGLTTLTILTAGAGVAFAQPAGFATAIDPIADCSSGGFRAPSYCTLQVVNCIANPFGTNNPTYINNYGTGGCATTLGTKAHTVAKVRYCGEASHRAEPACASTVAGANAAMWAKQNPDAPDSPDTVRPRHQFLKGTADGVDTAGVVVRERGALYFDTATFDGRALDGDATDGVAFFWGENGGSYPMYAGIMSGTDLGAPITQTSGTASWVGQFQTVWWDTNRDFVLEITFGGDGDKAGSIEAFVDRKEGRYYSSLHFTKHFYLKGEFDDSGLITGTVDVGDFTNKDRDNPRGERRLGILTGLIGQEGAVGAFHNNSNRGWYAGGFIARPPSELDTAFLDTTCSADPFTNKHQEFCNLEYADDRVTRINDCITGGNASGAECRTAREAHECISNPFASDCADVFTDYYETAQTNRIQFCLGSTTIDNITTSNITNSLCTNSKTVEAICDYAPFASACFDGDTYKSTRADKINDCHTNTTDPSCTGVTDSPNAVAWDYRLKNRDDDPIILTDTPSTTNRRNQFLKGTASGINRGDIVVPTRASGSLNLNTAEFNGEDLGGDAADGVAFIWGRVNGQGTYYLYAGIFSGTDLGAPLTQRSGTASWVGRIQTVNYGVDNEFVLEVDFNGTGDKSGYIEAFVQYSGTSHLYIDGYYDAHGVIIGTADDGSFTNNDRDNPTGKRNLGTLTGLIGKDGAVGVFISNTIGGGGYAGGFVARPANVADNSYLNTTCTNDPFGYLCYLEKDKQRDKIIECTEGSNASTTGCTRAVQLNECLTNPFHSDCEDDFAAYYVAARAKRNEFCVGSTTINDITTSNLTNSLCTGTGAKEAICTYAPFASICFDDNEYKDDRETKYPTCHADPSIPSCTGVTDRPNAIAWADSFVTTETPNGLPSVPDTGNKRRSQFLKGTASGLNSGDAVVHSSGGGYGSLNMSTAKFNDVALGGDAFDGVTFILVQVSRWYSYAGIFSGTDLGAPVAETSGTASWIGRFNVPNHQTDKEFVLEIDFEKRTVDAFVQRFRSGGSHFLLKGGYDAHGVITGTVDYGWFTNNDRDSRTVTPNGKLTGLIGEDGAVGAFINGGYYAGGFVARPPTDDELDYVATTCEDDPFHPFCHVDYEALRAERIGDCTASDDAATDAEYCGRAIARNPCITNPFATNCAEDLEHHYEDARANRISFCNDPDNADVSVCSGAAITNICTYDPFIAVCFSDTTYNSARITKADFCGNSANSDDPTCTGVFSRPNIASFLRDFDTEPPLVPHTSLLKNQFLKASATDLDDGTLSGRYANTLRLSDSLHSGVALGGDTVDGVAFFGAASGGRYPYYAGILSGTDLGAPLIPTEVPTEWNGKFQAIGSYPVAKDFTLKITFTTGEYAGKIEGFVQRSGTSHYHIQGDFNDNGVIANGTVNYGKFEDGKPIESRSNRTGQLRGLIGQEGAVGAFIADMNGPSGYYSGGFVARPPQ